MTLEQVFQDWHHWHNDKPTLIETLGGLSNQSYLVETKSGKFVIRLNSANENLGISRNRERQILEKIANLNFAPEVCRWTPNYLVTKYIKPTTAENPSLKVIADLFRQIHQISYSDQTFLAPLNHLSRY